MVYVYIADVTKLPDPKENKELLRQLPKRRQEKILRYKKEEDRKQSLGAGLLLLQVLGKRGFDLEDITYGVNGKPELEGIHFNLSHSHNWVVCAVSEKCVGCDIEKIDLVNDRIIKRFFSRNEIGYLESLEKDIKQEEFCRIWTMKESYVKMTGEGISRAFESCEFFIEDEVKVFRDGKRCDCGIKEYDIPEYRLTVCAQEYEFSDLIYIN